MRAVGYRVFVVRNKIAVLVRAFKRVLVGFRISGCKRCRANRYGVESVGNEVVFIRAITEGYRIARTKRSTIRDKRRAQRYAVLTFGVFAVGVCRRVNLEELINRRVARSRGKRNAAGGDVELVHSLLVVSNRGNRIGSIAVTHEARDRCAYALVGEGLVAVSVAEGHAIVKVFSFRQVIERKFVMGRRVFFIGD